MGFMEWSTQYELGIPEIDEQHKKWLELLNQFYDGLSSDNVELLLPQMIAEASDYGKFHFGEEEKFMERIGYPKLDEQKALHRDIAAKISTFREKVERGQPLMSLSVTNEFKAWFREHILIEDKKISEYYHSRAAGR